MHLRNYTTQNVKTKTFLQNNNGGGESVTYIIRIMCGSSMRMECHYMYYMLSKYEPQHDKTNNMVCAPSEDSDQPGHPPSLIRVLACAQWVAKDPSFLRADREDSDQTGRMPGLI